MLFLLLLLPFLLKGIEAFLLYLLLFNKLFHLSCVSHHAINEEIVCELKQGDLEKCCFLFFNFSQEIAKVHAITQCRIMIYLTRKFQ